jgi:DivIVA domain-containing protein
MPLTPEDVQNKEFTTVRLREGYEMQEVDEFLDEVEAELARLLRENEELRQKLAAVTRGGAAATAEPVQPPQPQQQRRPEPTPPEPKPAPQVAAPPGAPPHEAAAKVLALAQKTADELVADAKAEADKLLAESRSRSEQLDAETKARADKLEKEARQRSEAVDRELRERRQTAFGSLETERNKLEGAVESLRAFEREYRSRLKAYLEGQLRQLESSALSDNSQPVAPAGSVNSSSPAGTAAAPNRAVTSLLEDDQRR